jgi:hypothetical protein
MLLWVLYHPYMVIPGSSMKRFFKFAEKGVTCSVGEELKNPLGSPHECLTSPVRGDIPNAIRLSPFDSFIGAVDILTPLGFILR